jgi:outer membrane lipoprotein-sorting protein
MWRGRGGATDPPSSKGAGMFRFRVLAAGCTLLISVAALAESLEEVQKQIIEKSTQQKSWQAKMKSVQNFEMMGTKSNTVSEGTIEHMRKGDKALLRQELETKMATSGGGEEQKQTIKTLTVSDGEFVWTMSDMGGQKSAMKMRIPEGGSPVVDKNYFKNFEKDYTLKLLPDAKADGKDCWVIEMTSKQADQPVSTMTNYFAKDSGLLIKTDGKDKAGKTVLEMSMSDIKLNPTIAPERFEFKPPEGVVVMDMTKGPGAPTETKDGDKATDKPAGDTKKDDKKADPKKDDKKGITPKVPEVPKLPK